MGPCEVCGAVGVDANGFCLNCHTFRGVQQTGQAGYVYPATATFPENPPPVNYAVGQYPPPGQPHQAPAAEYPPTAPYSASPYSGASPYSANPYSASPYSGAGPQPGAPQSGAGYPPGPYPPGYGPPPQKSKISTPVLVTIVAIVLAAVAAGTTLVIISANKSEPTPIAGPTQNTAKPEVTTRPAEEPTGEPTAPATTAAPSSGLDPCVIGTWRETLNQQDLRLDGVPVRMTSSGSIQKFKADGTTSLDFGPNGITRKGKAGNVTYENTVKGTITFRFETRDNKFYYRTPRASGTSVWKRNGTVYDQHALAGSEDPENYICVGDKLREFGPTYVIELTRLNSTGA